MKICKIAQKVRSESRIKFRGVQIWKGSRQDCSTLFDLFDIYIDDVFKNVKEIETSGFEYMMKVLHFADKIGVFSETIEKMKVNIQKITDWCNTDCLVKNCSKI